jgi:hypothetical protein
MYLILPLETGQAQVCRYLEGHHHVEEEFFCSNAEGYSQCRYIPWDQNLATFLDTDIVSYGGAMLN